MQTKRHIVWSKKEIDLNDDFQKRWYMQQVLTCGRTEDIQELNWKEIKENLHYITLPREVKKLWENYFNAKR